MTTDLLSFDAAELDLVVAGHVVTSTGSYSKGAVGISAGRVVAVGEEFHVPAGVPTVDVGAGLILPGFVDAHVHCFTCPVEGFEHASRAAAAGGVTTIIDMPVDAPDPVRTAGRLDAKAATALADSVVDIALLGTVPVADPTSMIEELAAAGACGVMVSLFEQDPHRYPRIGYAELHDTMAAASRLDLTVAVHPETDSIIKTHLARRMNGQYDLDDPRVHGATRPPWSESHAVVTTLELALDTGARVHLNQLSLARSCELVALYREWGARVSSEVLLHHLQWSEDDMVRRGPRLKINPPLRSAENREQLWNALSDGIVDVVASDHSPWPLAAKQRSPFLLNESGAPGLETYPSLLIGAARQRRLPLEVVVQVACERPAQIFGLAHRKGDLAVGRDADLIVYDPTMTWIVDGSRGASTAGWDAHDGCEQHGRVTMVMVRGRWLWEHGGPDRRDTTRGEFIRPKTKSSTDKEQP